MNVAKSTPNPSDTAIGTMKAVSKLRSHIIGARPKKVVSDVSRIGRKRLTPASRTASARPADSNCRRSAGPPPACRAIRPTSVCTPRARLMKSTMIRLSLTTTPVNATSPNIDIIDTCRSRRMCPQTAPMRPNGIALMMMSGCT